MIKVNLYIGYDGLNALVASLKELEILHPLLLVGDSFSGTSVFREMLAVLSSVGPVTRINCKHGTPSELTINDLLQAAEATKWDSLIAIGGGAVIDSAKALRFYSDCSVDIATHLRMGSPNTQFYTPSRPLIAVPTISGSGSEATHFATIFVGETKYSLESHQLKPDCVVLDPSFSLTAPIKSRAASALDGVSQCIEALWSIKSNSLSDGFAFEALRIYAEHLELALNDPMARAALLQLARAGFLGGQAISVTRTSGPHALSYPLMSKFGIPHGHAVALGLLQFCKFNEALKNSDVLDCRGAAYVQNRLSEIFTIFKCAHAGEFQIYLRRLMSNFGLSLKLADFGVREEQLKEIAEEACVHGRMRNNPRIVSPSALLMMLRDLL